MRNSKITNDIITIEKVKTNTINKNYSNHVTQATKSQTNDDNNLILSNSQIDMFQIDFIRVALCMHFLFKDLSDEIM